MTVRSIISHSTPPLKPSDTVEFAIGLLKESRVRHLPVVTDEKMVLGVLSEDQLLDAVSPDLTITSLLGPEPIMVTENTHVFHATKIILDHDLTTIPVVSQKGEYIGLVRRHELFDRFARMLATQEPGSIVSIEVNERDFVLSRIIYLIEQNDGKVLSVSTEKRNVEEGTMHLTIKVNIKDVTRIRHLLEHNGYKVESVFGEEDDSEELLDRVQEFLRYLEV